MIDQNPYWGKNLFEFPILFIERMFQLLFGKLTLNELASDEIQVLVLALVASACATVGTFLVLKKMTMLANALSHTILVGIIVAYLLLLPLLPAGEAHAHVISMKVLLLASIVTGLITSLLTQMLTHVFKLQEDASTGLVFTTLFALGIVLVTVFTRNTHLGTEAIMGNVDALHLHDLYLIFWVVLLNSASVGFLFKEWKITSFDPGFASANGYSSPLFNYFLMVLTSATVIGAFRAVGVLLVLSFLVAPVLMARLMTHRLKKVLLFSNLLGIGCAFFGVALARHLLTVHELPLSTAGLVVSVLGVVYLLVLLIRWVKANAKTQRKI